MCIQFCSLSILHIGIWHCIQFCSLSILHIGSWHCIQFYILSILHIYSLRYHLSFLYIHSQKCAYFCIYPPVHVVSQSVLNAEKQRPHTFLPNCQFCNFTASSNSKLQTEFHRCNEIPFIWNVQPLSVFQQSQFSQLYNVRHKYLLPRICLHMRLFIQVHLIFG
jgi:hypothetical protein